MTGGFVNDKLTGFRGLLTLLGTWAMLFADTFFMQLSGLSPDALKAAFLATLPISIKLIYTDARPSIIRWINKSITK